MTAIASFTQIDPTTTDFSASVQWGDGQTSAAEIVGNDDGSFTVYGDHTYAAAGTFTYTVTIADTEGNSDGASGLATVTAPAASSGNTGGGTGPLDLQTTDFVAAQAQPFTYTLGWFKDSGGDANPSDFTATVNWGDGQSGSAKLVPDGSGGFNVIASHAYAGTNDYTWTLSIVDHVDDSVSTATGTGTATFAVLTALPPANVLATLTPGQSFSGEVASFSDVFDDGTYPAGSYQTSISWGDGQTTAGTITSDGMGDYTLQDTHAYAAAGDYQVVALVFASDGYAASATSEAIVSAAPIPLSATASGAIAAQQNQTLASTLASFTGPSPNASSYVASIDWGDGVVTLGTITATNLNNFAVTGSHVYTANGSFTATVTIDDTVGDESTGTDAVTVAAAPLLATGTSLTASANLAFTQQVATFSAADTTATASSFSALVQWGDGTTSTGTIVADLAGGFDVQGTHTYAATGSFVVTATVGDAAGDSAIATDTASVIRARLSSPRRSISRRCRPSPARTVATFVSTNPVATVADFTSTIAWGDGAISASTIQDNGDGSFSVVGSHDYAVAGSYAAVVTVTGSSGETASRRLPPRPSRRSRSALTI